jgi:bacterioferritin (cytochrome b1)
LPGKHGWEESIVAMQHADEAIRRRIFLDGGPRAKRLSPILGGWVVREAPECDGRLE